MGVGAGPYMYVVVVQKFTFAISSPDEFLSLHATCAVARSSTNDSAIRYVLAVSCMTSFSHNGANTSTGHEAIGELFTVTRQVAPGAKYAIVDYLLVW